MRQICRGPAIYLCLIMIMAGATVSSAQVPFRTLQVDERRDPYPGYYLFATNSSDSIGLMDHSGEVVIKVATGKHANPRVDVEGKLSHFTAITTPSGQTPVFVIRDRNLVAVDTIFPVGSVVADFHEGRIWSDSSFLMLGFRYTLMDLSAVKPGGNPNATVIEGVIQEIGFDGQLLFEWGSLDHIPVDQTCDDTDLSQVMVDYIHINAVERDSDGNLLVSCRHTDEVIKINRLSGAVMWRLGGSASKGNEFRFLNDTISGFVGFSHQHSAVRSASGNLLVFDNGNLKPEPIQSRVVEYEVDEAAKTVRRVWSYTPSSPMFSPTMGSVKELPSGSFVIGYGSGSGVGSGKSPIVAEEINRSGRADMRLSIIGTRSVAAYRFNKVQFGMTGLWREIASAGKVAAVVGDSSTNLELDLSGVARPTSIVIEKHHYRPHRIDVAADGMCSVAPYRWIVRASDSLSLSGSMSILSAGLTYADPLDDYTLYWRAEEGKGAFQRESRASYDSASAGWKLPTFRSGEYALATASCIVPRPISPADSSTVEQSRPTLVFSSAAAATAYEVEVSLDPAFGSTLLQQSVGDTSLTLSVDLPRSERCFWRVRRVRADRFGPWSGTMSFTVRAVSPVLVFPVSGTDTLGMAVTDTLRWRRFARASAYTVNVRDARSDELVLERTTADTMAALPVDIRHSRPYRWDVRAVTDTGTTASSTSVFGTLPAVPWIVYPEPSTHQAAEQPLRVMHRPIAGADSSLIIIRGLAGAILKMQSIPSGRSASISGLPSDQDLFMTTRGLGRYGISESVVRRFRLVRGASVPPMELVQPLPFDKIRMGSQVTYEWQPVTGAVDYHLQATTSTAFDRPDLDTVISSTQVVAALPAQGPFLQWRVQARTADGIGQWSDTVRIALRHDPLTELLPVAPAFGQRAVPTSGRFEINPTDTAASGEIQTSTDPYFDQDVSTYTLTGRTSLYSGLPPGRFVFWRAVKKVSNDMKLFGPSSILATDGVATVRGFADDSNASIAFDRATMTLIWTNDLAEVESVAAYDLLGRSIALKPVDGVSRWSVSGHSSQTPLLFVVVRLVGRPHPIRATIVH